MKTAIDLYLAWRIDCEHEARNAPLEVVLRGRAGDRSGEPLRQEAGGLCRGGQKAVEPGTGASQSILYNIFFTLL